MLQKLSLQVVHLLINTSASLCWSGICAGAGWGWGWGWGWDGGRKCEGGNCLGNRGRKAGKRGKRARLILPYRLCLHILTLFHLTSLWFLLFLIFILFYLQIALLLQCCWYKGGSRQVWGGTDPSWGSVAPVLSLPFLNMPLWLSMAQGAVPNLRRLFCSCWDG